MSLDKKAYLKSRNVQDDPWFKKTCAVKDAEELATLITTRFSSPETVGPEEAFENHEDSFTIGLPCHILVDMFESGYIEYHLLDDAMKIVMTKINSKEIIASSILLESCFSLIESFSLEGPSNELFGWLMANVNLQSSDSAPHKELYMGALLAYSYSQNKEPGSLEMWEAIWNMQYSYWWDVAIQGILYNTPERAIKEIPKLMERKCSMNTINVLWRCREKNGFTGILSSAIQNNEFWAGHAVNVISEAMKKEEKVSLLVALELPKPSPASS